MFRLNGGKKVDEVFLKSSCYYLQCCQSLLQGINKYGNYLLIENCTFTLINIKFL